MIADRVVVATNYEAPALGLLQRYVVGSTLSGSFTRVLTQEERASLGSLSEWGALSLHGGGATLRLTRDGRIKIRNTAEYRGARLLTDAELGARQAVHRAAFERRFPQLARVPFEYAWSGVEGITRNGTNCFGRRRDNLYYAGGYNGSGVSRGTASARQLPITPVARIRKRCATVWRARRRRGYRRGRCSTSAPILNCVRAFAVLGWIARINPA